MSKEDSSFEFADEDDEDEEVTFAYGASYAWENFVSNLRSTAPIVVYLIAFALAVTHGQLDGVGSLSVGIFAVVLGLTIFLEGLKLGVMPFCEVIGQTLPRKVPLVVLMSVFFVLGIVVTLSEPAIGALRTIGSLLPPSKSPYLFLILNEWSTVLQLFVGAGVGAAAVVGLLRQLKGGDLKIIIGLTTVPTLLLSIVINFVYPELQTVVSLAWDCGAVTTGPVTVPVILALGIGLSSSAGSSVVTCADWCGGENPEHNAATPHSGEHVELQQGAVGSDPDADEEEWSTEEEQEAPAATGSELDCFGIVTLASLFPVMVVQMLALAAVQLYTPEQILALPSAIAAMAAADASTEDTASNSWTEQQWVTDLSSGLRAIVPLLLFLILVLKALAKSDFPTAYLKRASDPFEFAVRVELGLSFAALGLVVFNIGLSYGLIKLGSLCGEHVGILAGTGIGIAVIVVPFAFFLGLMATLAEPALNALGATVERLSGGQFKKMTLIAAVAVGVASGVLLGILRILFGWKLLSVVIPGYSCTLLLTYFSSKEYVAIAWDSAGVTTGPVTVPLVLALGMGVSSGIGGGEGFGILTCASFCPIMSVLLCGLWLGQASPPEPDDCVLNQEHSQLAGNEDISGDWDKAAQADDAMEDGAAGESFMRPLPGPRELGCIEEEEQTDDKRRTARRATVGVGQLRVQNTVVLTPALRKARRKTMPEGNSALELPSKTSKRVSRRRSRQKSISTVFMDSYTSSII